MQNKPDCASTEQLKMDRELADALDAMDQGFLWLDENLLVKRHNRAYCQLLEIAEIDQFVGRPYSELLQFLLERGEFVESDDLDSFVAERMLAMQRGELLSLEHVRPNGRVLRVSAVPLPPGGYIYTYLDNTRESQAQEKMLRNTKATVVAMANFAEHRDTDTGVHVLRVARLVGLTARKLKRNSQFTDIVDEAFIEHVGTASILHDVGKISTPDRILLKAGPLSEEEWGVIKLHAAVGAQLLRQAHLMVGESAYLQIGAEIALTHHEWFNGNGYPAGLAGENIPLSGRICAIADVFDALMSRRPYKAPWSAEQAVALIRKQSGTQFDPVVVNAFVEVIQERETVSLVQWSDSMSVGNLHIDEQHNILIDTINQLASAESQNDRAVVSMIIDELVSYAVFHFQYEEQLMEAGGYPEFDKHRRIHQSFVEWITNMREEFIFHRRAQFGERILNFLRDWLCTHILGEDQRYRTYINN
ncbi:cyclic di-GMP phosphodiesterase response regulator RpfG [mine drainage metagenome]|uniref:Cyclic di-GMP phosphodiesterase response regulator RpfG n=1 Tax=mine drainage metagenome TaxID=410659 RepID=A0A1J5PF18_9ZZZZ